MNTRILAAGTTLLLVAGLGLAAPSQAAATKSTRATVAPAKPVAGAKTTLRVSVSPVVSSGTVRFTASGKELASCGARPVRSGAASCVTTFATQGTRTVAVRYSGTATYKTSTAKRSVTVAAKAPAVTAPTVVGGTGSCTTTKGALVGVSYGPWGGPVARGCSTSLTTGRALLTSAGFTLTNVTRFPGFICRIGSPLFSNGVEYPKPAQDPCVNTPSASAYWSFWTAAKGVNTWTYSPNGADSDKPTNGEVEAWTFGSTDVNGTTGKPVFTPAQLRAGLSAKAADTRRLALAAPGKTPSIDKGVDYLVDELVGGTHYEPFNGPDYGLTIDGAFALAATGTRDDVVADITDYLAAHVTDYTFLGGSQSEYADGGSAGKVALLAEVTGRNPRSFGGIDLIAALRKLTCTKVDAAAQCGGRGAYTFTPSLFGQALGVIAQLRAGDTSAAKNPIAYLESRQTRSGGFASDSTGTFVETDSTAMAAMALALVPGTKARTALTKALRWLASQQRSDGGFPGASGNSVNSAALSIQALRLDAETYSSAIAKGQRFLAAAQNRDGGFRVASDTQVSDVRASAQAVGGSVGTPFASLLDDLGSKNDATDGADYLVGQLVGGDHYTSSFGGSTFDDQGLTADGVFALLSTGGHQDSVDAMVAYLKAQVGNYADPTGAFGGPYSGSLAKLALIAESTGNDPHTFGDTDLLDLLTTKVCTDAIAGDYSPCTAKGDFYNAFSEISQALGILALQASPVSADHLTFDSSPVVRLRQLQCADGGFTSVLITGHATCTSGVDATGFAIQALATVPGSDAVLGKAQHYLEKAQRPDGLFVAEAGANSNSTALAAVGLQTLVTALHSETVDPPGPKTTTPIVSWQSALTGLRTLAVEKGGYGISSSTSADLRSSTQAVLAAAQRTLVSLSGAPIASTPRDAFVPDPGTPTPAPSDAPTTSPAPAGGSASPIGAGNPADTGVTAGAQLTWALAFLLLGTALAFAGRRRVADAVGRHRPQRAR